MIELSVIVPTHNRAAVLGRCLRALASQEGVGADGLEIIVVDDGSSDETEATVARAQDELPSLIYLKREQAGPASARNAGLRVARGSVVWIINDDSIVSPRAAAAHLEAHYRRPETEFAAVGPFRVPPDQPGVTPFMRWAQRDWFKFERLPPRYQEVPFWYFMTCNLSAKTSLVLAAGGFDEGLPYAAYEDTELGYRLSRRGMRLYYLPEAVAYHWHPVDLAGGRRRMYTAGRAAREVAAKMPPELLLSSVWVRLLGIPAASFLVERALEPLAKRVEDKVDLHWLYKPVLTRHFVRGLEGK